MGRRPTLAPLYHIPWHTMGENCPRCTLTNNGKPTRCVIATNPEGHDMGYRDENQQEKPTLSVGCVFDGAMGWHNTYRIVDLALEYGMDKDPDLGWDDNDRKIMAAYENSEDEIVLDDATVLDQAGIGEVAQHWSEKALDFLDQFCPPFHHLQWDDGLYVWADEVEEADARSSADYYVNEVITALFAAEPDYDNPLHLGHIYKALAERFAALAEGGERE